MPVDERAYFTAVNLARRGEMQAARNILQNMIKKREDDEQTWVWLAATYASGEARLRILEAAVKRYPEGEMVGKALDLLKQRIEQQKLRTAEKEQASPLPPVVPPSKKELSAGPPGLKRETGNKPAGATQSAPYKKTTRAGDLGRMALAVGVVLLTIITAYLWTQLR